jgi:hypothetical protein
MFGSLWHRFGPGRLPYTDRRDVGGGVAMAATALLVTVLWVALVALAWAATPANALVGLVFGLGVSSPLAVLGALGFGTVVWRYWIPERPDPVRGAAGGAVTALVSLVPVAVVFGGVFAATNAGTPAPAALVGAVVDLAMGTVLAYLGASVLTGPLAVPLGLFGGWYHERARRDRGADAGAAPC